MNSNLKIDYSLIFENMTAGLCVVEVLKDENGQPLDFIIAKINSQFKEIFHKPNEDVVCESVTVLCDGIKDICLDTLKSVYSDGVSQKLELFREDLNKQLVIKIFKPDEKYICVLITDVTEQKIAEDRLKENENNFRKLYESVAGGVVVVGDDYIIRDVNERACEITGYNKQELIGQLCDKICPKGKSSKECPVWAEKRQGFKGMDTKIKCKDGFCTPIIKDAKRLTLDGQDCIFENFHDISTQKRVEKELLIAKEKAEESNRLKSAFLANVSHEIRTPMNGILGFADLLRDSDLSVESQKDYIEVIERNGRRMLSIINDLISISRIEAGQVELCFENININSTLTEQLSFFKLEAESKGLELVYNEIEDKTLELNTDSVRLNQVLCNLLNNAIKYTKSGKVEFGCCVENGFCRFYVNDTGMGIEENLHEKVFDRFRQGELSRTKKFQGVGLGLSISKAYVEKLGGSIWVDSIPGKGSTFYFSIPLFVCKESIDSSSVI